MCCDKRMALDAEIQITVQTFKLHPALCVTFDVNLCVIHIIILVIEFAQLTQPFLLVIIVVAGSEDVLLAIPGHVFDSIKLFLCEGSSFSFATYVCRRAFSSLALLRFS